MKRFAIFILFIVLLFPVLIQAQTYPEVWFENSNLPVRYSNSKVSYQGNSWIKNLRHQLPVSDSIFFTPKNSLELYYTSGNNGSWVADISYSRNKSHSLKGDAMLCFKMLVQSETSPAELPALIALQADSTTSKLLPLGKFVKNYEQNKWLSVEIPVKELGINNLEKGIEVIRFAQNTKDGKEHHLLIDQMEIMPKVYPLSKLTSPAVLSSAVGFEKHVNLTWKLPLTPSIRYIKVYRSDDNKMFYPVAIRPIFVKRYTDIVPEGGKEYYYKIAWVDYKYQESPVSEVLSVKTKVLTDSQLVTMVQQTGMNYVFDGEEFNSGMQLNSIASQTPTVSVRNTGIGILALIANVKADFALKDQLLKRLEKVVSFLEKAESAHGVYPELLNGRTGKGVYSTNQGENILVNLESTGMLMQALLVSKEYFNQSSEVERQLRTRINKIWRAVEWNAFIKKDNPYLYSQWSSSDQLEAGIPLSGLSKMYLYILALASPEFNIEIDSYSRVLQNPLEAKEHQLKKIETLLVSDDPENTIQDDVLLDDTLLAITEEVVIENAVIEDAIADEIEEEIVSLAGKKVHLMQYDGIQYNPKQFINGKTYYGLPLAVGNEDDSVKDLLIGFIALNPNGKQDEFANYSEYMKNLIKIQHRKSLEEGIDFSSSKLFPLRKVAIYPFEKELAVQNIKEYYLNHTGELWNEYGFVREVDFKKNSVIYTGDNLENALLVVMIENGESGLIWKLFAQDSGISEVLNAVFGN